MSSISAALPRSFFSVAALVMVAVAVGAMTALHLLQPELSPVHQPVSFYVHGDKGWLLPFALASFAGSAIAVGAGLRECPRSVAGCGWLIGFGAGMLVDAVVPSDRWFPWEGDYSVGGAIHACSAVLAPPLLLGAMIAIGRSRDTSKRFPLRALNVLSLGYLIGLIASGVSLGIGFGNGRSPPCIGLAERFLALAAVAWIALVASTLSKRSPTSLKADIDA
jgi:hypothetical protein